jgi:hypothetical protein
MTASSSSSSTISSPLWLEIFEAARLNDVQTLEHVFASQSLDEDQLVPLINRKHPQFDRTALMLAVAWNAVAAVKLLIK